MTPIFSLLRSAASPITLPIQKASKWVWQHSNEDTRKIVKTVACSLSSVVCTMVSSRILSGGAIPVLQVASAISVSLVASRIFSHPSPKLISLTLAGTAIVLSPPGLVHVAGLAASTYFGGMWMRGIFGLEFPEPEDLPELPAIMDVLPREPLYSSLNSFEGG